MNVQLGCNLRSCVIANIKEGLFLSYVCYNEEGVRWSNRHEYLNALNNVQGCAPVPPYSLEFEHLYSCILIKATGSG